MIISHSDSYLSYQLQRYESGRAIASLIFLILCILLKKQTEKRKKGIKSRHLLLCKQQTYLLISKVGLWYMPK